MLRSNTKLTPVPANFAGSCVNNTGSWSISLLHNSSRNTSVVGSNPYWCFIRQRRQLPYPMAFVIVAFLFCLVLLILYSEIVMVRPIRDICSLQLRYICMNLTTHRQFCWAEITQWQRSSSVVHESHVWIWGVGK